MRLDLVWALNKTYTACFAFIIWLTRFSGHVQDLNLQIREIWSCLGLYTARFYFKIRRTRHVQALKYTKTRDLSLFRLLIRPTQPNGHVLALKSTKDVRSDPIWVILNIPGHLFCWRYLWLSIMAVHRFLDTQFKKLY